MALEAALIDLCDQLKRLAAHVEVSEKRAEDTPEGHEHYLAGEVADAARDTTGWLRKAKRMAQKARREFAQGKEVRRVRDALIKCQHFVTSIQRGPARVLLSTRKKEDLKDLAQRRARIWNDWAADLSAALQDMRKPWRAISKTLCRCWQELADHATASQVMIQNIAVGQQITDKRGKQLARPE